MHSPNGNSLVLPGQFIQAVRDAGYKSLGAAIAELVDNSFEACADKVCISIASSSDIEGGDFCVVVSDDGAGMDVRTLGHSLQFGWSSRFNRRESAGRYGMGLPNASLSHARRVEVWTSTDGRSAHRTHLDVDDIVAGKSKGILPASHASHADFCKWSPFAKGTTVVWKQCDRIKFRSADVLAQKLMTELGRLFRHQIWSGKTLVVNGKNVAPFDPLFEGMGANLSGASAFGPEITYEIAIPQRQGRTSAVRVRFTELPVDKWHNLSNEEKNSRGIAKRAGVSVVRAWREIDRGWFFMGQKRQENYDDWWRCEVRFEPELDELFGVTHTKQEIHPTEPLLQILTPDIERIARELNGRARRAFNSVRGAAHQQRESEKIANRFDSLIEPPVQAVRAARNTSSLTSRSRGSINGLEYRLRVERLDQQALFVPSLKGSRLTVLLNEQHPFVRHARNTSLKSGGESSGGSQRNLELMILAAARAEVLFSRDKQKRTFLRQFHELWSNILATFLS